MKRISKKRVPNRRLIALRINAGLSPNQLASRIHVSGPTIRLAEQGHIPEPRVQFELAEFFEMSPLDIWPLETQKELAVSDDIDLVTLRRNRGLSLSDAAEQMELSSKSILFQAEGGARPHPKNAFKIASFYGFKVTEVWPLEDAVA